MIRKILVNLGLLLLLTACRLNIHPVNRTTHYEDPKSELIKALLTEKEISDVSSDFYWHDIIRTQNQSLDADTSSHYEKAQSAFFGNFQNPDQTVMLFHTLNKYNSLIDKNRPTLFLLSGYEDFYGVTGYIPEISASGAVVSKCVVIAKEAKQICDVHVKYNYIESDVNLTTRIIGKEVTLKWLNAIVSAVEPRIMAQDSSK